MSDDRDDKKPDPSKPPPEKKGGWMANLARRSTGLPKDVTPPSTSPKGEKKLWTLAGLGLQFAISTVLFAFIGNALDHKMGWSPWGLVSLVLIAVVGNLYLLIKESLQDEQGSKKK